MTTTIRSQKRLTLIVAIVAVIALGLAVRSAGTANADDAADGATTYAVLGQPASAADAVTAGSRLLANVLAEHPELGLQPADARVIDAGTTFLPEGTVAVIPAAKAPCLYRKDATGTEGLSCGRSAGETASVGYDGAIGVVPDAVKTVTFTMTDGSEQVGTVDGNVWRAPLEAKAVAFDVGGETRRIDLMPRSTRPAGS